MVVAESAYTAQDAVELIQMDVDILPAVVDPEQAAQPGSPKVHEEFDDNIMFRSSGQLRPHRPRRWASRMSCLSRRIRSSA